MCTDELQIAERCHCDTGQLLTELRPEGEKIALSVLAPGQQEVAKDIVNEVCRDFKRVVPKWKDPAARTPEALRTFFCRATGTRAERWLKEREQAARLQAGWSLDPYLGGFQKVPIQRPEVRAALLALVKLFLEKVLPRMTDQEKRLYQGFVYDQLSAEMIAKDLVTSADAVRRRWLELAQKLYRQLEEEVKESPMCRELFARALADVSDLKGIFRLAKIYRTQGPEAMHDLLEPTGPGLPAAPVNPQPVGDVSLPDRETEEMKDALRAIRSEAMTYSEALAPFRKRGARCEHLFHMLLQTKLMHAIGNEMLDDEVRMRFAYIVERSKEDQATVHG